MRVSLGPCSDLFGICKEKEKYVEIGVYHRDMMKWISSQRWGVARRAKL